MSVNGALSWSVSSLRRAPTIDGHQYDPSFGGFAVRPIVVGSGLVPSAIGNSAFQAYRIRGDGQALPLSPRYEMQADLGVTAEEDYWRLEELKAHSGDQPPVALFDVPIVESWKIDGGRTAWKLPRAVPWGTSDSATYPATALIRDADDGTTRATLTIISSGTPTASEIVIANADTQDLETADLVAHAGHFLVLRYTPLRLLGNLIVELEHDADEIGIWRAALTFEDHLAASGL